jgi:DNA-binding NarL/FixJ family response regulator
VVPTSGSDVTGSVKRRREARYSPKPRTDSLSSREIEVCTLLVEGLQLKQVAIRLNISIHTADSHARNSYQKLGLHSRAALVKHFVGPNVEAELDSMPLVCADHMN